ncbi:MAG: CDP-2,3-bis-(O-geranylgeranyl)-sn-glycerol synthase [Candidatus Hydrothermarchaeaceae archaeon]
MFGVVLHTLYFFIPAYVANTFACILGGGRALDFGRNFIDGRRILGDGVTIRGSVTGILCGTVAGLTLGHFEGVLDMSEFGGNPALVLLLSSGAIVGDAAGSFLKRRLGIEKGAPAPVLDQLNFVVGALVFARFVREISLSEVTILFVLTPIGHLIVNKTGYLLKMKDVPW